MRKFSRRRVETKTDLVEQFYAPKLTDQKSYWLGYALLNLFVKGTDIEAGNQQDFWGSVYSASKIPIELQRDIYHYPLGSPRQTCLVKAVYEDNHISDGNCEKNDQAKVTICTLALEEN